MSLTWESPNKDAVFRFSGNVTRADVARFYRNLPFVTVFTVIIITIGMVNLAPLWNQGNFARTFDWYWAGLLFTGLAFCLRAIWFRVGLGMANRIARSNPSSVGRVEGEISSRGIRIASNVGYTEFPLSSLTFAQVSNEVLLISTHAGRATFRFLPMSIFDDNGFGHAAELCQAASANSTASSGLVDNRKHADGSSLPMNFPSNSIPFQGSITKQDMNDCAFLAKGVRKQLWTTFAYLAVVNIVLLFLLETNLPGGSGMTTRIAILGALLFVNFRILRRIRLSYGLGLASDQPLIYLTGAIAKEGVFGATPAERGFSKWDRFENAIFYDDLISLTLPGSIPSSLLIARRFFQTEELWTAACQLVQSQFSHRHAGT